MYIMTDTHDTHDTPSCNTSVRARCWGPNTWNNWTEEDLASLTMYCEANCEDYAINQEVGVEGTPHLQFCMKFKNARMFDSLKKSFPKVHWERSKNWAATKTYCCKSDTAVANTIKKKDHPYKHVTDDEFVNENLELFDWQERIESLMMSPVDRRKIMWMWEPDGNRGKTSFVRHLIIKFPREVLFVSGKAADIKYAIVECVKKGFNLKLVIFHCVRSMEQYISYEAIESVKDGIFFSGKFESGMVIFNRPHCLCIANFEPDTTTLSKDRWEIVEL